ncbi:MAG TPA: GNAT family N-acetyltransferase [Anaerolineales bacterium]|nr:GNAT family N-acetyltransferase [Anaerolineales bacterium]
MDTNLQVQETSLAPGLKLRSTQWADLNSVAQLTLDVLTADGDPTFAMSPEEVEREWKTPGFELERDTWVVETAAGRIVGYEVFLEKHAHASLMGDGYVHPEYRGRGVGTTLLRALDGRAREEIRLAEPGLRVFLRNITSMRDTRARELHENEGYQSIRFSWHMEIDLDQAPRSPVWPAGIELRPFVLEAHNRAVFEADEEAFRDHWGHTPGTFEDWQHQVTGREDFDPSLWLIAWDGDEIAGYSLCRYRMGNGWVDALGVRRPWRKLGLGEALLLHSFAEFHQRGTRTIGLIVDSQNPSGATRLYQKVGMHATAEFVYYEKELRPGRELEEHEE